MLVKYIRDKNKLIGCIVGLEPGKIGVSICHDKPIATIGDTKCEIIAMHGKDVCVLLPIVNQLAIVSRKAVKVSRDTFTKKEAKARAIERAQNGTGPTIPHRFITGRTVNSDGEDITPIYTLSEVIAEEVEHMEYRLQPKPPKVKVQGGLMGLLNRFM